MLKTYIALLRGINVSGQKIIKMAELKNSFEVWGFKNVRTYIQSGNIVFSSDKADNEIVKEIIGKGIKRDFGFNVEVFVLEPFFLEEILTNCPYLNRENKKALYFTFLLEPPLNEHLSEILEIKDPSDEIQYWNNMLYLYCGNGYGKSKFNNNFIEKRLKVSATTRNLNTVNKLIDMAMDGS